MSIAKSIRILFYKTTLAFALGLGFTAPTASLAAAETLNVVVTLPEIAEIVRDLGGSAVEVTSLLTGAEDPHFIEATPTLIAKVSRADIVCAMGLDLEGGWLPKVLSRAANAKVQPGGPGFCELGRSVTVLEKLSEKTNRSKGDIHAAGNPHFNLSPRALAQGSEEVLRVLKSARPALAADFDLRASAFAEKMKRIEEKTREVLKPAIDASAQGPAVIEYHREFAYFLDLYSIRSFGAIEEKPGIAPSAGRLARVSMDAKNAGVRLALAGLNAPIRHVARFSELSGIPGARVPTGVQSSSTIEQTQLAIAEAIARALGRAGLSKSDD